jgi:hypothetical protein
MFRDPNLSKKNEAFEKGCFRMGTPTEKVRTDCMGRVLRTSVGNMMENDEEDVKQIKNMLYVAGHRKTPAQNGIIEQQTDDAIRSFQKFKGLKVDGIMKPGGETEQALKREVEKPVSRKESFEREESILNDTPAQYEVERDPKNIKWDLWDEVRTFGSKGKEAIKKYDSLILKNAEKHNLDPDLIRAVMYAEHSRGHKGGFNDFADKVHMSDSIMPMNIQNERWAKIIGKKPEDMYNPDLNIEAATILLKRIRDRIKKPTPEKIGTLWNGLSMKKTTEFGEYIGGLYHEKPWKKFNK